MTKQLQKQLSTIDHTHVSMLNQDDAGKGSLVTVYVGYNVLYPHECVYSLCNFTHYNTAQPHNAVLHIS